MRGLLACLELYALVLTVLAAPSNLNSNPDQKATLDELVKKLTRRTENGIHLPLLRSELSSLSLSKRGKEGAIGLGNFMDIVYNVLITVGGTTVPVVLDTGSSDLWVISDACSTGCATGNLPTYPQASFNSTGVEAQLLYGDSQTGTHAFGLIGTDTASLAGLTLQNQYFAAINDTNTSVVDTGSAGIFGLGFPINSVLLNTIFSNEHAFLNGRSTEDSEESEPNHGFLGRLRVGTLHQDKNIVSRLFPKLSRLDFHKPTFPSVGGLLGSSNQGNSNHVARQSSTIVSDFLASYDKLGPLLTRLVSSNQLTQPLFAVTLQRDTVQIGGNVGMLSIGELPETVKNESLIWVPLRAYSNAEGGLPSPPGSNEVYPIAWEVFVDDVFLDGERLPRSQISSSDIKLSALVDTGNSLIRGPADLVDMIIKKLGDTFPCREAHSMAFSIGGKMFPVDPRDFTMQAFDNDVTRCTAKLVATDPPQVGGYLYSWSLGDPFLRSVLTAYHYGNLTHPSQDQPRMGFLSTVPSDAADQLQAAVDQAGTNGGNFPSSVELPQATAPSGTATNSDGVLRATATSFLSPSQSSSSSRTVSNGRFSLVVMVVVLAPAMMNVLGSTFFS
ncbi:hypothetical protein AMATHDRAFT_63168 [Amanita thiersii Skay4041]|uniref:Peptidase A1 domain-containing protein n=1 Tax=Amanita thiersii Skay4041 TaxID=703135 RepID=A0A2A9NMI6_9AGAR|nr:hypothetical protein AMATHDRAFT_63168 [Amanita thiersii Skay4041]